MGAQPANTTTDLHLSVLPQVKFTIYLRRSYLQKIRSDDDS